jgi:putative hemolysin
MNTTKATTNTAIREPAANVASQDSRAADLAAENSEVKYEAEALALLEQSNLSQKYNLLTDGKFKSGLAGFLTGWKRLRDFLKRHNEVYLEQELSESLAEFLDFGYTMSDKDSRRIPSEGRLLMMANRPLGGLDTLALLLAVRSVRRDVHVVVQDPLTDLLRKMVLKADLVDHSTSFSYGLHSHEQRQLLIQALQSEKVCIVFPAARPDTWTWKGLRPARWQKALLRIQKVVQAPVLPVHISGRNSLYFYIVRALFPRMAEVLQLRQAFYPACNNVTLRTGDPIDGTALNNLKGRMATRLLQKHIKAVGTGKRLPFQTYKNIIRPVERKLLRQEVLASEELGSTSDGMKILITTFDKSPGIIKEIARLRELTFRKIGEGTGNKKDLDRYDRYYRHLYLWDDREMEIVGAYRLGVGKELLAAAGEDNLVQNFYAAELFEFQPEFIKLLPDAIECGRSFVQEKYWNSLALDYLWHGIGAFIARNPQYRWLFGPVSISASFPAAARNMLIHFYKKWFGAGKVYALAGNPVRIPADMSRQYEELFCEDTYQKDFKKLKHSLKQFNMSVPTLYKQYSELCESGGVQFADFGVDEDFGNCTDGFIIVDIERITDKKRARYIDSKLDDLKLSEG